MALDGQNLQVGTLIVHRTEGYVRSLCRYRVRFEMPR